MYSPRNTWPGATRSRVEHSSWLLEATWLLRPGAVLSQARPAFRGVARSHHRAVGPGRIARGLRHFRAHECPEGTLLGMLPFAAVLVIVSLGQTLVVQQGGIDLSVPGAVSLAVVICTHEPRGADSRLLPGGCSGPGCGRACRRRKRPSDRPPGPQPHRGHAGMNALLYAGVLGISGGAPRRIDRPARQHCQWSDLGRSQRRRLLRGRRPRRRRDRSEVDGGGSPLRGRGREPGRVLATGIKVTRHRAGAYIWAQVLYRLAGVLLAGIIVQPTASRRRISASLGCGRRARGNVLAWRSRVPRGDGRGRALPESARAVRVGPGRQLRCANTGRSCCARRWRCALHRQLESAARTALRFHEPARCEPSVMTFRSTFSTSVASRRTREGKYYMVQTLRRGRLLAGMGAAALVLAACGGSDDPESFTGDTGAASGDRPSLVRREGDRPRHDRRIRR